MSKLIPYSIPSIVGHPCRVVDATGHEWQTNRVTDVNQSSMYSHLFFIDAVWQTSVSRSFARTKKTSLTITESSKFAKNVSGVYLIDWMWTVSAVDAIERSNKITDRIPKIEEKKDICICPSGTSFLVGHIKTCPLRDGLRKRLRQAGIG